MYILILLAAITVVIYVVPLITGKFWDFYDIEIWGVGFIVATVVLGLILMATYGTSLEFRSKILTYGEMISEYERLVETTQEALLDSDSEIPVENLQHSTAVANRMAELRDYRRWYKESLREYRSYCDNWLFGQFVAPLPEELR